MVPIKKNIGTMQALQEISEYFQIKKFPNEVALTGSLPHYSDANRFHRLLQRRELLLSIANRPVFVIDLHKALDDGFFRIDIQNEVAWLSASLFLELFHCAVSAGRSEKKAPESDHFVHLSQFHMKDDLLVSLPSRLFCSVNFNSGSIFLYVDVFDEDHICASTSFTTERRSYPLSIDAKEKQFVLCEVILDSRKYTSMKGLCRIPPLLIEDALQICLMNLSEEKNWNTSDNLFAAVHRIVSHPVIRTIDEFVLFDDAADLIWQHNCVASIISTAKGLIFCISSGEHYSIPVVTMKFSSMKNSLNRVAELNPFFTSETSIEDVFESFSSNSLFLRMGSTIFLGSEDLLRSIYKNLVATAERTLTLRDSFVKGAHQFVHLESNGDHNLAVCMKEVSDGVFTFIHLSVGYMQGDLLGLFFFTTGNSLFSFENILFSFSTF